ncbi:hypothetical protein AGMMS49975_14150 [Clostridia bacterium]|nr:hypothetical protein AGMMS49975_14150 [Clostridia bacterium]
MKFDFKWKDSLEEARKAAETLTAANEAKKQAKSNTDNKKAAEPTHTLIAGRYIRACGDGEYRLYPFAKKEYMWRIPKKFILKYGKITVGDYKLSSILSFCRNCVVLWVFRVCAYSRYKTYCRRLGKYKERLAVVVDYIYFILVACHCWRFSRAIFLFLSGFFAFIFWVFKATGGFPVWFSIFVTIYINKRKK